MRFLKTAVVLSLLIVSMFASSAFCSDPIGSVVSVAAEIHKEEMRERREAIPTLAFSMLGEAFGTAFDFRFDDERMSRLWRACRTPSLARSNDAVSAIREMARACGVSGYEVAVLKPENTLFLSEAAVSEYLADGGVMVFFEDMSARTKRETERSVKLFDNLFTVSGGSKSGRILRSSAKDALLANSARMIQRGARLISLENGVATLSFGRETSEMTLAELESNAVYIVGVRKSR